eukprot:jgi/Psemu1/23560/gm1.23560_g
MASATTTTVRLPEHVSETLEYLQPHHIDEAATLLADSFLDDAEPSPMYGWVVEDLLQLQRQLLPGGDRRTRQREALRWLFRKNLEIQLEQDAASGIPTSCRCAFLRPPDEPSTMVCFFVLKKDAFGDGGGEHGSNNSCDSSSQVSSWTMVRHGMLWFPILFGFRVMYRLLVVKDYYEGLNAKYSSATNEHRCRPCWMLERMVVHHSVQKQGIGSYFLKRALGEQQDERCGCCLLQTQEERNVAFYSKLGFAVVKRDEFGDSNQPVPGCTNWLMARTTTTPS